MIFIVNKRKKIENVKQEYPDADILDLTSKSEYAKQLSPFYPHGNIPIPFSDGRTATCVEAVWQGLKVFEKEGVSDSTFKNDTMKNIKRTVRKLGKPLGHQKGLFSEELLDYFQARVQIYLPTYKWMLENVPSVIKLIERIKIRSQARDIVFLDYNTNSDYKDLSSPLSHAGLVKLYIEGNYPSPTENDCPLSKAESGKKQKRRKTAKKKTQKSKSVEAQLNLPFD